MLKNTLIILIPIFLTYEDTEYDKDGKEKVKDLKQNRLMMQKLFGHVQNGDKEKGIQEFYKGFHLTWMIHLIGCTLEQKGI